MSASGSRHPLIRDSWYNNQGEFVQSPENISDVAYIAYNGIVSVTAMHGNMYCNGAYALLTDKEQNFFCSILKAFLEDQLVSYVATNVKAVYQKTATDLGFVPHVFKSFPSSIAHAMTVFLTFSHSLVTRKIDVPTDLRLTC